MNKRVSLTFRSGIITSLFLGIILLLGSCTQDNSSGKMKTTVADAKLNSGELKAKGTSDSANFFLHLEAAVSKIKSDTLKVADLPGSITYKGHPVKIMNWKDKLGENLLLLTETGEFASKDSVEYADNRDAELHVYHYLKTGTTYQLMANVNDFINSCPVDIETSFIPGALFITDLDANGIAECTFAYHLTCTGGVDNSTMKLIMLENKHKYVIRGRTTVYAGEKIPGTMKYEAGIPDQFKPFMTEMWSAFETEHH